MSRSGFCFTPSPVLFNHEVMCGMNDESRRLIFVIWWLLFRPYVTLVLDSAWDWSCSVCSLRQRWGTPDTTTHSTKSIFSSVHCAARYSRWEAHYRRSCGERLRTSELGSILHKKLCGTTEYLKGQHTAEKKTFWNRWGPCTWRSGLQHQ